MRTRGFTLIEVLVVISVIALMIGILLPSLGAAREAGRAVACQAHLRGVLLGLSAYELDHAGWLAGPNSSGSDLQQGKPYRAGASTPVQDWDYVSPILGDELNLPTDNLAKFQEICMTKLRCPSNRVRYTRRYSGAPLPIESTGEQPLTLSYLTPAYFQMYPTGVMHVGGRSVESVPSSEAISLPRGYSPRSHLIGDFPDRKAFVFEGARYYDPAITGFDYSTDTNGTGLIGTPQGNFLSRGSAFFGSGENYLRDASGGYRPTVILKQISLRHSERMNAGMFDGHVQAFDNAASANPALYVPSRSILKTPTLTWHYYLGEANSPLRQPNAVVP